MTAEIIDQASALEEMMRDSAIQAHHLNRDAVSATHCEECDDQLSDDRRKAYPSCTMCVECKGEKEIRNKKYSRNEKAPLTRGLTMWCGWYYPFSYD